MECRTCHEDKSPDDFYAGSRGRSNNQCKPCQIEYQTRRYRGSSDVRQRQAEAYERWKVKYPGRAREVDKARRQRDPEKWEARRILTQSVRWGKIDKPTTCSDCGESFDKRQIQGHHEDYSKPLEVLWLCGGCHGLRHRKYLPDQAG